MKPSIASNCEADNDNNDEYDVHNDDNSASSSVSSSFNDENYIEVLLVNLSVCSNIF